MDRASVFHDMFIMPQCERVEGTCEEWPIMIHGVTAREFDYLLKTCIVVRYVVITPGCQCLR